MATMQLDIYQVWLAELAFGRSDEDSDMAADMLTRYNELRGELAECRRTRALGGPPPPVDKNWANADVGRPASADDRNAPALRRDRNGGEPG